VQGRNDTIYSIKKKQARDIPGELECPLRSRDRKHQREKEMNAKIRVEKNSQLSYGASHSEWNKTQQYRLSRQAGEKT
jgi:hypothetical protein